MNNIRSQLSWAPSSPPSGRVAKQQELAKRVVPKQPACAADKGRAAQSVVSQPVQAVDCGRGALRVRTFHWSTLRGSKSPTYTGRVYAVGFVADPRITVSASVGSCPAIGLSASRLSLDLGGARCVLIARAPLSSLTQRLTFVPSMLLPCHLRRARIPLTSDGALSAAAIAPRVRGACGE